MKSILLTGAAKGIGRAVLDVLYKQNYTVYATVQNESELNQIKSNFSESVIPLKMDLTDEQQIEKVVNKLADKKLDALINNAGVAIPAPVECTELQDLRHQFEVNYFGLVNLTQKLLPQIRKSRGRIIFLSSIFGRVAHPFVGSYCSTKYAVEALADCLRREVYGQDVKVSLIEPGAIDTGIWEESIDQYVKLQDSISGDMRKLYGKQLSVMEKAVKAKAKTALPPTFVAQAVLHALDAEKPKIRYAIGWKDRLLLFILKVLPDKWIDDHFIRQF